MKEIIQIQTKKQIKSDSDKNGQDDMGKKWRFYHKILEVMSKYETQKSQNGKKWDAWSKIKISYINLSVIQMRRLEKTQYVVGAFIYEFNV